MIFDHKIVTINIEQIIVSVLASTVNVGKLNVLAFERSLNACSREIKSNV